MIALILLVLLPKLAYQYEVFYDDSTTDSCLARCKDQPIGHKIQDPTDCVGYILCHGDFVVQQYCAPGEKFDESLQKCVRGKCPPCNCPNPNPTTPPITTPSTVTPPKTTPSTVTPPITTASTGTPPITTPSTGTPPITTPSTATPPITTPSTETPPITTPSTTESPDSSCVNRPNGYLFPNKNHCRLFWVCNNGVAISRFCQIGMWYQRTKYVCDFPKNVHDCPANQD